MPEFEGKQTSQIHLQKAHLLDLLRGRARLLCRVITLNSINIRILQHNGEDKKNDKTCKKTENETR